MKPLTLPALVSDMPVQRAHYALGATSKRRGKNLAVHAESGS